MKKRILHVADQLNNILLLKRIVMAAGYDFSTAAPGENGWQIERAELPDLIFIDQRAPGDYDGYELLRRLKEDPELQRIPVVFLTASGHDDIKNRAIAAGNDALLPKPADIRQVRAVLRYYLGSPTPQSRTIQQILDHQAIT